MASVDFATVRSLLAHTRTFSGRPVRITSIYNHHPEEKCFLVETDDGFPPCKVRFASATNKLSVATEHEALRILRQHGLAWAPHIYEFRADDPAYLIVTYKEGESLDKSLRWVSHARTIIAGLDQLLADMHKISGGYFGHLAGEHYSSWQAFMDVRFWHHISSLVRAGLINQEDLRRIHALYDEASEAFRTVRPSLLHSDVKPANILFDAELGSTILIDFELARFGDVSFEWVRFHYLALRWPEYRNLIAKPFLEEVSFLYPSEGTGETKMLLYALYHVCSLLAFECEAALLIPSYRLDDLREVLQAIRSRNA